MSDDLQPIAGLVDAVLSGHGFKVKEGLRGYRCQSGEEYVEVQLTSSDGGACARYIAAIVMSCGVAGDTVYWRDRPEQHRRTGAVKAYCRFLVSGEPERFETEEEAEAAAA